MSVYVKKKLVSSKVDTLLIKGDEPLSNIVDRLSMPDVLHDYLNVSIDGVVIPKENWANTIATNRHVVYIAVVPQGGGDSGKNPLAMIAMVALSVFTMGTALPWGAIMTGSMAGGYAVAAGVMFVGMLLINALFPPPTLSTPNTSEDSAGFFGMEGLRNRSRPHKAVRNIYGTYKVAPDIAVEPYVLTSGDVQVLYAIYDFGYGEINLSNILIGNTPIENYTNTYAVHTDYTDGDLDYYQSDNVTESYSTEITGERVTRVTDDEANEVNVNIKFPLGLVLHEEDGNVSPAYVKFEVYVEKTDGSTGMVSLQDLPYVHASHAVTYETLAPLYLKLTNLYTNYDYTPPDAQSYSSIRVSDTFTAEVHGAPSGSVAGAVNPQLVLADQTFILNGTTFTIVSASTPTYTTETVNAGTVYDGVAEEWVTTYTYHKVATYASIVLDQSTAANGIQYPYIRAVECNIVGDAEICNYYYVPFDSENSFLLTTPKSANFVLGRTTSLPFVLSLNLKFPSQGEWNIHITRLAAYAYAWPYPVVYRISQDWVNKWSDRTDLISIQSITTTRAPLAFKVGHTILELKIIATDKISGVVDTLTAICQRVLPYYSSGVEAGTKVTSNPAWIALQILMGDENPDPIPTSRIDFTAFEAWAAFCGENVDPLDDDYHVDCNWDANSTVFERLVSVMAAGRATISTRENKYSVIYEQFPTVPVQLLTTKNSWGFKGTKIFAKQPHAINVGFVDPLSEWQMQDRVVYADGYAEIADGVGDLNCVDADGDPVDCIESTYFEKISMPLCTSSDRAWKAGRYYIAQGKLRPESFAVSTDVENLLAERGDLIELQYDSGRMGGISTRITAITGANVTLREPVEWGATPDFYLRIRKDDGSIENEIQVISQADAYNITLASTPSPEAKAGDLCVYGEEGFVTDQFLVKSVTPNTDLTATFNLVPIARAIEDADTGTIPDYLPPINPETMIYPVDVSGVDIAVKLYYENRKPKVDVSLNWTHIGTNVNYDIWLSVDGTDNYQLIDTVEHTIDYVVVKGLSTLDADYNSSDDQLLKIVPTNIFGHKLPLSACQAHAFQLPTDTEAPGKPLFFAGNINADTINLTWFPPVDEDIAGYIIKYTTEDTPDWDTATAQGSLTPYNITTANYNARIGSYMIKTIDTSGNYSDDFGLIKTTIPSLQGLDNFSTLTEHSAFSGAKSNVEVVSSGLRLIQDVGNYVEFGTYTFNTIVDLGDVYNAYISSELARTIINSGAEDTLESYQDVIIQIKMSSVNPVIGDWVHIEDADPIDGAGDGDWSGWQNLYAGHYTGRYFAFRAVLVSNKTFITPHVYELSVKVDMIERIESENDVTCASGGSTITFTNEFKDIPAIAITQDDASLGDYFNITNQAVDGFDIEFFDSTDTTKASQFDWMAKGYGALLTGIENPIEAGDEDDIALLPGAVGFITNKNLLN